jgi:predicted N-acetyltransferase YhbS
VRRRADSDGRRQAVSLTETGREAWRTLDQRSTEEITALLDRLDADGRDRLLAAMATIRELLGGRPRRRDVILREPAPGDLGWLVQRHGALYAQEYGYDETFEGLVAGIVAEYARRSESGTPGVGSARERERAWIAEVDGVRAGCILCVRRTERSGEATERTTTAAERRAAERAADSGRSGEATERTTTAAERRAAERAADDERTAQLRVLLVEPWARGMGVGGRLVDECLRFARDAGYSRIVLFTYDAHRDARRIYQRVGFALDEQRPVRAHGHDLVEQVWSRAL